MVSAFKSQKGMQKVLNSYDELLKTWNTEFAEQDVHTTFGTTHCIISGSKENPPLLLFHGVGDNSAVMWALNIKELSRHFYCIAVDTLGGPGKSIPNENFTKKIFSQQVWINELADHYELESFNISGVSNGAAITYNYLTKESGRIIKAICMEGGMVINPFKSIVNTLGLLFPEILFPTKNNMIRIMKKLASPNSNIFEKYPQIVEHLILLLKNHNQRAMFPHKLEKYNKDDAAKIRNKLLFLIGGYMLEKRKEFIDVLVDGGFNYKIIENAGHGINHDQPDIINEEIKSFILYK